MKNRILKKVISFILIIIMLVTIAPTPQKEVKAAGGFFLSLKKPSGSLNNSTATFVSKPMGWESATLTIDTNWYNDENKLANTNTFKENTAYKVEISIGLKDNPGYFDTLDKNPGIFFTDDSAVLQDVRYKVKEGKLYIIGAYNIAEADNLHQLTPTSNNVTWRGTSSYRYTGFRVYEDGKFIDAYDRSDSDHAQYIGDNVYVFQHVYKDFTPGSHTITIQPFINIGGDIFWGTDATINVNGISIVSPKPVPVKISSSKVCIHWSKVKGADGYYVYAGSKKIKTTSGTKYIYSKSGASKKTYSIQAFYKDGNETKKVSKSSAVKPVSNKFSGPSSPSPSYYGEDMKVHAKLNKVAYTKKNSKGKVKVTMTLTSCHTLVTASCKVKVTIKSHGKTVASQTFKTGKLKPWSRNVKTFTFSKARTGMDLKNIDFSLSVKELQ